MRIGVRGHDYGCASPEEMAKRISDAGFSCFQLALHKAIEGFKPEYGQLNPGFCYSVRKAFENKGLEVAVLGCYIEPGTLDEDKRLYDVKRFKEQVAYARQLGSYIVGTETSRCDDEHRENQFELLLDSVKLLAAQAEKFGVFVGIEPVLVHTLNTPELAGRMLNEISSPNLQIILDPINLLSPENIEHQHYIIDSCFDIFGDRIVAVHAKDVVLENGVFRRCVIGQGIFDHEYFYKKLNKTRPGISVLREEAHPETAHLDIEALRRFAEL